MHSVACVRDAQFRPQSAPRASDHPETLRQNCDSGPDHGARSYGRNPGANQELTPLSPHSADQWLNVRKDAYTTPKSSVASHGGRVDLSFTLAHNLTPTLSNQYYPLGLYFALGYHPLIDLCPEHPLNFWLAEPPAVSPPVRLCTGWKSRGWPPSML
jgi:hypothetical protein